MRRCGPQIFPTVTVKIGDKVMFAGRLYVVRGFTRMGSRDQHVVLADAKIASTLVTARMDLVEAVENDES